MVKSLPANAGDVKDASSIPGLGRSLEEGMATHSSILAWRLPWTEEAGGLLSTGSQRIRHQKQKEVTNTCTVTQRDPWRLAACGTRGL